MPDKKTLLGMAIGVGLTIGAPMAVSVLTPVTRPLVKSLLKRSMVAVNRILEGLSLAAEGLEDLVAEVRAEVDDELARTGPRSRRGRPQTDGSGAEAAMSASADGARSGAPS